MTSPQKQRPPANEATPLLHPGREATNMRWKVCIGYGDGKKRPCVGFMVFMPRLGETDIYQAKASAACNVALRASLEEIID